MNALRRQRLALQLEREELRLRCAAQRSAWAREAPLGLPGADLARRTAIGLRLASRWVRANPALAAAGAAAGLLLLRPRRVLGWAGTLLTLWSSVAACAAPAGRSAANATALSRGGAATRW